ncbi:MAG: tRNA pseudouridine(55) synthase TruB [Raoultibacter sp.]
MAAPRGTSGLSLIVGVNKPAGMSSHDVVNRVRRIFGERRVGHTGTLDPLATGALAVCIGPATRLDHYLTGHDKVYRVHIVFGAQTETDDAAGEILETAPVPDEVFDPFFAQNFVQSLVGSHKQLPPVYSAIKVDGKRSYKAARAGTIIDLAPRAIEIYAAHLVGIEEADATGAPAWDVDVHVSKGTYIRSLARDIGVALGTRAYVGGLQRTRVGDLALEDCVDLDVLETLGARAALDPVKLLGLRVMFADAQQAEAIGFGKALCAQECSFYAAPRFADAAFELCACSNGLQQASEPLADGEIVCVVAQNVLAALYVYDKQAAVLRPRCIFAVGVCRGAGI